jgi:hypothetical protein
MAAPPAFSVHVINPRKKSGGSRRKKRGHSKKKAARKSKAPTQKPAKKSAKKRTTNMAKKRRKRSKRAPAKRGASTTRKITRRRTTNPRPSRRRRRKNPSAGINAVTSEMKSAIPRILGMMAAAWAVRRFSEHGGLFSTPFTSPMMGESWSWKQYAIAGAVATWGPALAGKMRINATEFRRGAVDLIMVKLIWTEGFARSEWAQNAFGTGDVAYTPGNRQAYVDQGGRWDAMQGLVEASPLDGLVEASPLDGPGSGYGHLLPAGVPSGVANIGKHTGSGHVSQYHAAFGGVG